MSCLNLNELDPYHLSLGRAFTNDPSAIKLIGMLSQWQEEGHICLKLDKLDQADKTFILDLIKACPSSFISFEDQKKATPLYFVHTNLYLHKSFRAETLFIDELYRFLNTFESLSPYFIEPDDNLNSLQNLALKKALEPGMLILTGGPGTGKTFTAKKIAKALIEKSSFFKRSIILAAPTSKALDQLKKSVGTFEGVELIADTLHKLVEYFSKKPAYLNASCIIIDEASMIEAPLMAKLFSSLGSQAKVILMGDPFQLPPVGLGSFFHDLLSCESILPHVHHVHLSQSHRCQEPSINKLIEITHKEGPDEFLNFLSKDTPHLNLIRHPLESFDNAIFENLSSFFDKDFLYSDDFEKIKMEKSKSIILSTLRRGPLGVDAINKNLSQFFSSKSLSQRYYLEPIMLLETDKERGLFNGQTGLKVYDRKENRIFYRIQTKILTTLSSLKYTEAFALSVHKSQGSEYDEVLFMLPQGSEKFSREIIYTALTRVRKKLTLWLDEEPLKGALLKSNYRQSGLLERIKDKFHN
jgi:exodeoxyribonuclease V alpha subunit